VRVAEVAGLIALGLVLALSAGASVADCTGDADCDDTLYCSGAERCIHGECVPGEPPDLDDDVECTNDRCDEIRNRILHTPLHDRCSDGRFCNGEERCQPLLGCRPGNPPPIDDGVDCTLDACDELNDIVFHDPVDVLCHDGNECTINACDPTAGCTSFPREGTCDDRKACTSDDECVEGVCVGVASRCGDGLLRAGCGEECDDGNGWNWDDCNALCRIEAIPRLASGLPAILSELDDLADALPVGSEVRARLQGARFRIALALWFIEHPDTGRYHPVPPALHQLAKGLRELEGPHFESLGLAPLIEKALALARAIALDRLDVVECADSRCELERSNARRLVQRAQKWELRGKLYLAADRYKDAWAWLDGQP
jgi:cysteine-rich repeat protein